MDEYHQILSEFPAYSRLIDSGIHCLKYVLNPARARFNGRTAQPFLGTCFSPRMRRADIEVPNLAVDVDSWAR